MTFFKRKGRFYILNNDEEYNMPINEKYSQGWFCVSQLHMTTDDDEIKKMVNIWKNKIVHNCTYSSEVNSELKKYTDNLGSITTKFIH